MDWREVYRFTKNHLRREIASRLIRPHKALFFLTYRCSSRCTTCVMWKREHTCNELTLDDWKRIVDECAREKVDNIEMFGGDALLRREVLSPLIRHAVNRGIGCGLTTNGLLLDNDAARSIVKAGTETVYLSIDATGEDNDAIRGVPGAFCKTLAALRYLKSARETYSRTPSRPKLVINTTVSKRNVRALDSLVRFVEKEKPDVLALEYVGEFSTGAINDSAVHGILPDPYFTPQEESSYLSKKEAEDLMDWIQTQHRLGRPRGVVLHPGNIEALSSNQMASGRLPWKKCYVCRTLVVVDPLGQVLCCPFYSKYHLGNIARDRLSEIWGNKRHRCFVAEQTAMNLAVCSECILSVERNPGFFEGFKKRFFQYWHR